MASDLPIDPYLVLGVEKDADLSTIRSVHRKLVLKLHPDRIKDEAERVRSRDEFQKVQEAWELLSDPAWRSRYDDRVKLAQLRKEAMEGAPPWKQSSEYRDGRLYRESTPSSSYFEEGYRYRQEGPRRSSRKYDDYEPRSSAGREEKENKNSEQREKAANNIAVNIATKLKAKAKNAREAANEKTRKKESHASGARPKDRDKRRSRSDIQTRRAYVEDESSSDSDTATYVTNNRRAGGPYEEPTVSRTMSKRRRDSTAPIQSSQLKHFDSTAPHNRPRAHDAELPQDRPGFARTSSIQGPNLKRSETYDPGSHDSRGRGFWGSDPGSPRQTRPRASSICSNTSSRNGSLRGHKRFDSGYQQPTYSRPRAGSAASGGSAGSRYDIDRTSPGLPPMPRTRYQIVDDEQEFGPTKVEPEDRRYQTRRPPLGVREEERRQSARPSAEKKGFGYKIVDPEEDLHHRTRSPSPASRREERRRPPPRPSAILPRDNDKLQNKPRRVSAIVPSKEPVRRSEPLPRTTTIPSPEPVPCESPVPHAAKSRKVECDVCGLEVEVGRKRDWQKHIFEDLRPYQCLETGCKSASETYPTCMNLLTHMKEQHPKSELLSANELACPFCQEVLPGKKLQRLKHVGSHMEEIALTAITRSYEDWTFYSDSEKYLSSVCGEEHHRDKKLSGSLDLPSARSGLESAPEESTAVQTEIKMPFSTAQDASVVEQSGQAGPIGEEDWYWRPAKQGKKKLRREARCASVELNSAKTSAPSAEDRADRLNAPPPRPPPRFDEDLAGGNDLGWGWGWGWGQQPLGPSSQNHDDGNPPSQPHLKTTDAIAAAKVAYANNCPPETTKQARKTDRGELLGENANKEAQPNANTTRPSEQTGGAKLKSGRPRVQRTGGASSWGDWGVSYAPQKKKHRMVVE